MNKIKFWQIAFFDTIVTIDAVLLCLFIVNISSTKQTIATAILTAGLIIVSFLALRVPDLLNLYRKTK